MIPSHPPTALSPHLLERALQIAVTAHAGQIDKAGQPYIFHPIRVMGRCAGLEARILALLHDTVEDTPVTFAELAQAGFPASVLDRLRLLTHDKAVPYDDYITAILGDPVAIEVKLADLADNTDLRRLSEITPRDVERLQRYLRALHRLRAGRPAEAGALPSPGSSPSQKPPATGSRPTELNSPETVEKFRQIEARAIERFGMLGEF